MKAKRRESLVTVITPRAASRLAKEIARWSELAMVAYIERPLRETRQ